MCNTNIHDELIDIGESKCPLCDELLTKGNTSSDLCCEEPRIVDISGIQVCINCGIVHPCISKSDYIDFYKNVYRIRRKSIYIRRYHIENIMNYLLVKHRIELTWNQRDKIYRVFEEIGYILPQINNNRKRMISTKYIIKRILEMMDLSCNIPVTQSKRTLAFYNRYWSQIMTLIGDKIENIVK